MKVSVRLAFLFALTMLLAGAVAPARAQEESPYEQKYYSDPFYREIRDAAKTKSPRDMVQFLTMKIEEDPDRINPASLWLRDNTVEQRDIKKVDALYFMLYSDIMRQLALAYQKAGDNKGYLEMTNTSAMSFYIFEMMASVDAMRCADPSVREALEMKLVAPRLAGLEYAFKMLPKIEFDALSDDAVAAENKFAQREPNTFICSLGNAKLSDMLHQPNTFTIPVKDPATGLESTRVVPPPGYEYSPTFITDPEWISRRDATQKHVVSMWKTRYETLSHLEEKKAPDAKDKKKP